MSDIQGEKPEFWCERIEAICPASDLLKQAKETLVFADVAFMGVVRDSQKQAKIAASDGATAVFEAGEDLAKPLEVLNYTDDLGQILEGVDKMFETALTIFDDTDFCIREGDDYEPMNGCWKLAAVAGAMSTISEVTLSLRGLSEG